MNNNPADVERAFSAVRNNDSITLLKLIEDGSILVNSARGGSCNNSLLHEAASNGNKKISKILLRHGLDICTVNNMNESAAHFCYKFNYIELAEYLISKGLNDGIKSIDGGLTCYEYMIGKD